MIKKILKAVWILFLEVISIPLDIIAFIIMLIQAMNMEKRYGTPIREYMQAYRKNIKGQYIARINWIKGDNSIWKF